MRLKHLLFVLFGALTIFPVLVFWLWSHSQILQSEFDEVRDRHLLLARNLGAALQRYHRDVSATFELLSASLARDGRAGQTEDLLKNLEFRHVCLADATTGIVIAEASRLEARCPKMVPKERFATLKALAAADRTQFTPVMNGPGDMPIMYVIRLVDDKLAIGALRTDYFVRLGKAISFGVKGHAAIVDNKGNVLAHPLDSWIASRKNISKVSAVKRMLRGETGIQEFYSPALKGDMIAGFTSVPGPGWGVMIPQPVAELHIKAAKAENSALTVLAVCLLIVIFLSIATATYLSRPLEHILEATHRAKDSNHLQEANLSTHWFVPIEFHKVLKSFNRMVRRLRDNLIHIKHLAYSDPVTGLPNRESFRLMLQKELKRLRDTGESGAMLFVDLDEFKAVNDTMGHDGGDTALRAISTRLIGTLQFRTGRDPISRAMTKDAVLAVADGAPMLARIGGDEFVIFVPGAGDTEQLQNILEDVKQCLVEPVDVGGEEVVIGASIGAARFPADGDSYEAILKRADIAMYHAKRTGKNKVQIYSSEIGEVSIAELRREVSMAIKNGEFVLHYQPKINCQTNSIESVEALIRWNHSERGFLFPGAFIPMVEESDVIVELGEWVVRAAVADMATWREQGTERRISVNISARHFCSANFVERITHIIDETGVDRRYLELEITEEAAMTCQISTQEAIDALHAAGIRVSLDDFGRGYSNLSRLADLSVDTIKIDDPLTARVTSDERVRAIIRATVEMAEGLGCQTVAEGVETMEQAACLVELGCTHLQGYHFAKPMEKNQLLDWIKIHETGKVREMQDLIVEKLVESA